MMAMFACRAIGLVLSAVSVSAVADGVKVSSFGYDVADSTRFLQAALSSGAKKIVIDRQVSDWVTMPLLVTNSNLEVVLEDGVVLCAKRKTFRGPNDCLLKIDAGASNVVIRGVGTAVLRMNKADYLDPEQKYPFSEWRHAVNILTACQVAVSNLTILSSGGDGVYVGGARDVVLEDLKCRDHNRQGISVTDVRGLTVRRCEFSGTCGTSPQAGLDIEPNAWVNHATDVLFEDCVFSDNRSHGVLHAFLHFDTRTEPVSVTYRRCQMLNNRECGCSFVTGYPNFVLKRGRCKGKALFEDCRFSGNGAEALKVCNHGEEGLDVRFRNCRFDARGSKAESAILLTNAQLSKDFGSLVFDDCAVLVDEGKDPLSFEAPEGIGIGGRLTGRLGVDRAGKRTWFDLDGFVKRHRPHPEKVRQFSSTLVDTHDLHLRTDLLSGNVFTPSIRNSFVCLMEVPSAGRYGIRFKSRRLRTSGNGTVCGICQLLDRFGTDMGRFEIPEGDYTHVIDASSAALFRLEVQPRNTGVISTAGVEHGVALLADRSVALFKEGGAAFRFVLPAGTGKPLVDFVPEEPASAQLIDGSGKLADEIPIQTHRGVLRPERDVAGAEEVWTVRFPVMVEDLEFQLGGKAVPIAYPVK